MVSRPCQLAAGFRPGEAATVSRETLLDELLSRYEALQRQGHAATPEEVCADHPELLEPLQARLKAHASMEAFLAAGDDHKSAPEAPPGTNEQRTGPVPERDRSAAETFPVVPSYEVLGVLGRGGMGVVYQARHLALKRVVALKVILAGAHAAPDQRARFRREAEAVARLQHPHVVQVYEVGERPEGPYCALEFAEGGSLDKQLAGQPQPVRRAAELVEVLAQAVQAAHEAGVVHRDLKPANVLLTADGTPKVTDFGLAKLVSSEAGAS